MGSLQNNKYPKVGIALCSLACELFAKGCWSKMGLARGVKVLNCLLFYQ